MKSQKTSTILSLITFGILLLGIVFLFLRDPIADFNAYAFGGADRLAEKLIPFGIEQNEARQIVDEHPDKIIRLQIQYLEFLNLTPETRPADPSSFLRSSIRENYPPPEGYLESRNESADNGFGSKGSPTVKELAGEKASAAKQHLSNKIESTKEGLTSKIADKTPEGLVRPKASQDQLAFFRQLPGSSADASDTDRQEMAKALRDLPLARYAPKPFDEIVGQSILSMPDTLSNRALVQNLADGELPSAALWVSRLLLLDTTVGNIDDSRLEAISRYLEIAAEAGYPEAILQQASYSIPCSLVFGKFEKESVFPNLTIVIERLESLSPDFKSAGFCPLGTICYGDEVGLSNPSFYLGFAHHLLAAGLMDSIHVEKGVTGDLLQKLPKVENFVEEVFEDSRSRLSAVLRRKSRALSHAQQAQEHYSVFLDRPKSKHHPLGKTLFMVLLSDNSLQSELLKNASMEEATKLSVQIEASRPQAAVAEDPIEKLCDLILLCFPGEQKDDPVLGDLRHFPKSYVDAKSSDRKIDAIREKSRLDAIAESERKQKEAIAEKERIKNLKPVDKVSEFMALYLAALSTEGEDISSFVHPSGMISFGERKTPEEVNASHQETFTKTYFSLKMTKLGKGPLNTSEGTWIYRVPLAVKGLTRPSREIRDSISYREYHFIDTLSGLKITYENVIAWSFLHETRFSVDSPLDGDISVNDPAGASLRSEPSDSKESTIIEKLPNNEIIKYWPCEVKHSSEFSKEIKWNFVIAPSGVGGLVAEKLIKPSSRKSSDNQSSPKADPPDIIHLEETATPIPGKRGWVWHPKSKQQIDVSEFSSGTRVQQGGYSFIVP